MSDKSKETAGYKFAGVVEDFAPIGASLKPTFDMEVVDMDDPEQSKEYASYLESLKTNKETQKFFGVNPKKPDLKSIKERAKANPGDLYVTENGKKIPLAQYLKNKKALNTRKNHSTPSKQDSSTGKSGVNNNQKFNPESYSSMSNNVPKDGG